MSLAQKEKLYLDSCAAYNADKKQIISDDEFEEVHKPINTCAQTHANKNKHIHTNTNTHAHTNTRSHMWHQK
jgi:hypothetical protein